MYFLRGHPSKKVGFLMMTWKYPASVYPYSNSLSKGRIEEKLLKWLVFLCNKLNSLSYVWKAPKRVLPQKTEPVLKTKKLHTIPK